MATAKEQLLSMMSPQQARLLDQQLRSKEIANRSQGAGMLSGLVQAYTGMADTAQRASGVMPMGLNEAGTLRKREVLQAKAAQDKNISDLTGEAVSSNDVERLKAIRDKLIATENKSAIAQAQKIQKRIEDLEEAASDASSEEALFNDRLEILEGLGITGNRATLAAKNYSNSEFESFITKKQKEAKENKNKSYVDGVLTGAKGNVPDSVWNRAYALSEVGKYSEALKTVIETQPPPTPQTRKYIKDNYENAEEILAAQDEGKRWTGEWITIPEEKNTDNPVPLKGLTPDQKSEVDTILVNLIGDDPDLKAKAKLKGVDVGKEGFIDYFDDPAKFDTSQRLAIYNKYRAEAKKNPSYELKDAVIDYITDGNKPKGKPKEENTYGIPETTIQQAMAQNPNASREAVIEALRKKFNIE